MLRRLLLTLALAFALGSLQAATIPIRLYLNSGQFLAVDSTTFPAYAFNPTPQYHRHNTDLHVQPGDSIALTLINTDNITHGFAIKGTPINLSVPALDSIATTFPAPAAGLYIYHDPTAAPTYSYLGAAGILLVRTPQGDADYFWNFHDFQPAWNTALTSGQSVNWNQFRPTFYTVNGLSYPDLLTDSTIVINRNVGDTIRIHVANTGLSTHSLHFHGYHVRILTHSQSTRYINWSKDTMPIESMHTMTLELVPDKPGLYPVHDHNQLAVTGGMIYPNGLMLMLDIQ